MNKRLAPVFTILLAVILAVNPANTGIAAAVECATPIAPNTASTTNFVNTAYQDWKSTYVTSEGANGNLRVQRSAGDNYDTVSEGIAYGMLFAVYNNDKNTFDKLWAYEQSHLNSNGVMNWRINADGSTAGENGATDAEVDMAAALIAADTRWGGYRTTALKQISLIKQHEVEAGSNVLKPGDVWGGSNLLNPSYLSPAYFDVFASYANDSSWKNVEIASYNILKAISINTDSKTTGLVPDWSTSTGAPANGMSYNYGYDGSRAPLRLAMAANWTCDANAKQLLAQFNKTFKGKGLTNLSSSYALNGTPAGSDNSVPILAAAASAATSSDDTAYRTTAWNTLASAPAGGYYPDSMRLFSLMVSSGVMVSPLTLSPAVVTIPVVPAAPSTPSVMSLKGTNSTTTIGNSTTLNASVSVDSNKSNMIVDLELYDSNGNRVAQKVYENQPLTTIPKNYSLPWTPTSEGEYTLKGGIFSSDWSSNLHWNDTASKVMVTKQPAPVIITPPPVVVTPSTSTMNIWWPGSTQAVSGVQPFKAVFDGLQLNRYNMYWQVDGGSLNTMYSVNDAAPHKESLVDLTGWSWSPNNKYVINFVAKDLTGGIIGQKSTVITINR